MRATEFDLKEFPPVSYEQWQALAEADLKGASFEQKLATTIHEGINIQPLYTRRDALSESDAIGLPGEPPFVRSSRPLGAVTSGCGLRQEHAHPELAVANRAIKDDLAGGVTSLLLRFDVAARDGLDPDDPLASDAAGRDGLMVYRLVDLDAVLAEVPLSSAGIALEAGAAFVPASATLMALWQRRGISPEQARGAFNADPLTVLAKAGRLPVSPETTLALLADLTSWTAKTYPHVTAVGVDTAPYDDAGATAAQAIAFAVATGVEYLRALTNAGMDIDAAARQILFNFSIGTHHFLAIGKLRAARRVWSRIIEACGGSPDAGAMHIHARISRTVLTRRDPYVNLLRNTVGVFAAGLGGAEWITSVPFDACLGPPDDFSRRIARNTLPILQEEAHLNRVVDPAGGSWFLDRLTQDLAESAWKIFQDVERQGGLLAALKSGWIAEQIAAARTRKSAHPNNHIANQCESPDAPTDEVMKLPLDLTALRAAAVARAAAARKEWPSLTALENATERTTAAIAAANDGATIGQIARALGFHRTLSDLPLSKIHNSLPSTL